MKTNLGIHLNAALRENDMTQTQLAESIGIKQSTINLILNAGRRPHPDSLAAITGFKWPKDNAKGVSLLLEHLRDEIDRARIKESHPKTHIEIRARQTINGNTDTVIDSLRAHAQTNPDVARLLIDLLTLLDDQDEKITKIAADPRTSYKTNKPVK